VNRQHQTTILVVEDEPVTLEIAVRYLERAGFVTRSCSTGEAALSILRTDGARIDWLLTDINLPGCIDGWVVGAEFHLRHPLRPVIYVSSFAPTLKSSMAAAVYVAKPYSPAEIAALIQQLTPHGETRDRGTPADRRLSLLHGSPKVA
jgi:two-component system, OmpR family, response regulator